MMLSIHSFTLVIYIETHAAFLTMYSLSTDTDFHELFVVWA